MDKKDPYKAQKEYQKKTYHRISLIVKKERINIIKQYCRENGKTVNGLINELLEKEIPELKYVLDDDDDIFD